jgi:hypothetical protein
LQLSPPASVYLGEGQNQDNIDMEVKMGLLKLMLGLIAGIFGLVVGVFGLVVGVLGGAIGLVIALFALLVIAPFVIFVKIIF